MSSLSMNNGKNATKKERKSWLLRETLPYMDGKPKKELCFTTFGNTWECYTYFNSRWFAIKMQYCGHDINCIELNLRIGISERNGKEIIAIKPVSVPHKLNEFEITELILLKEFSSLMKSNDKLELFVEVQKENKKTKTRMKKFQLDYKELLLSGKNSDLTINVKRKKFEAHKLILGARSPVFSAMMEHEMKEKLSGEVTIQDIEPDIFQAFLLYLYTGSDEHLKWENVVELYKLGDRYGVKDLKTLCVKNMTRNISEGNFFEIFLLSQQHSEFQLSEFSIKHFTENSKKIIESEDWITFLRQHPDETNVLIKTLVKDEKN